MSARSELRSPRCLALAAFVIGVAALAAFVGLHRRAGESRPTSNRNKEQSQTLASQLATLQTKEQEITETVWKKELQAEKCGYAFEELWDALNIASNKLALAATVPLRALLPPNFQAPEKFAHRISRFQSGVAGPKWNNAEWRAFLKDRQGEGWELAQTEFRHNRLELDQRGQPNQSRFYFSAHLSNSQQDKRAILEGDLIVQWDSVEATGKPVVASIDASHLTLETGEGAPGFQLLLNVEASPFEGAQFVDPLILYDLDGDGLSEIILAARNLLFKRGRDGKFQSEPLCQHPPGIIFTGLIADFDGDGEADFLCATVDGLLLFKGSSHGTFDQPGVRVWTANPKLEYGQVLTCGDIDGDGDLDLWLGQYKSPYERGQMATPYFDANDGHPSYLLLNDGRGHFSDATGASGLGQKRWRRCYSASFVDLDGDGDLDLAVVSDFAGLDLYTNDGRGHFTDVTRRWIDEPHAFGMALSVADFDADGTLDLLMIGMNSPAAERLDHLGLKRPGFEAQDEMRSRMIYGNRLFLGKPDGTGFTRTKLNDSVARTGWSWGCSSFDFDNDGFTDIYIANGHESRQSVHDHETEFWLHDIYVSNSRDNPVALAYMANKFTWSRERGYSYGGYEKNRLFWNQHGQSFMEVAHLLGVGLEADSRAVVADDLDGDGKMDLLVTTIRSWPTMQRTLRAFNNVVEDAGNWIGFRLREEQGGSSPVGARIAIYHPGGTAVRQIITGDSYRSQQANTVHFGLGPIAQVDKAEIRWPNGRVLILDQPKVNQYHAVKSK